MVLNLAPSAAQTDHKRSSFQPRTSVPEFSQTHCNPETTWDRLDAPQAVIEEFLSRGLSENSCGVRVGDPYSKDYKCSHNLPRFGEHRKQKAAFGLHPSLQR